MDKQTTYHLKKGRNELWFDLFTIDNSIIPKVELDNKNRLKSWKYGYDEKHDIIIISKDGTIGDIYLIEGLRIALPKAPKDLKKGKNKWVAEEIATELKKIQSKKQWDSMPEDFRIKHVDYILQEQERRDVGHWFTNNSEPTYITGDHYMYLQHTRTDVGHPDFRESNRVFFIFWEACVADPRCFGMMYTKNRRSGFSFMASSMTVNAGSQKRDAFLGILSKTGDDAKSMFTGKVVPISNNYPFFFKPIRSGMDVPKTELIYDIPATKITRNNMHSFNNGVDMDEGLGTTINWKKTTDNSYDGEKLFRLVHDEAAKWTEGNNIINNWKVTKTCLRVGNKVVGKVMMGSTVNAHDKGGAGFKTLWEQSDVAKRSKDGKTTSGMYRLFIPMEWNFEGCIDEYGFPVFLTPDEPVMGVDGEMVYRGAIDIWNDEIASLRDYPDQLNEHYRQYPRTISHAFRDEAKDSIFNLEKIYSQIEINEDYGRDLNIVKGSFHWRDGKEFTEVIFTPNKQGRFYLSWIPHPDLQNNVTRKGDIFVPKNGSLGSFGCDSYDIAGVVGGGGSKGALHGLTKSNTNDMVPSNKFFLEYIARPETAEVFYDDVIMAIWFYGMPVLVENNKPGLLKYMRHKGLRKFAMDRPDKSPMQLSKSEKEIGGIPNTSVDVIQLHANCIGSYIEQYVGYDRSGRYRNEEEPGDMPFERTLMDWSRFKITDRTKHDASISSGLAIMANRKDIITPMKERNDISFNFVLFDNSGGVSKRL